MASYWSIVNLTLVSASFALVPTATHSFQDVTTLDQKPALAVEVVSPVPIIWPKTIEAGGWIAPWSEALVSSDIDGAKIETIEADVGDVVRKGQVLATLSAEPLNVEKLRKLAAVDGAQARLEQAAANAERSRLLSVRAPDAQSQKALQTAQIEEKIATASLAAERASLAAEQLNIDRTVILAPDDGVISSKSATLGALPAVGDELFRLIRHQRLEWRAEVPVGDLAKIEPQQQVKIDVMGEPPILGRVRSVSPVIDRATGRGVVNVALSSADLRSGAFATGKIHLETEEALALPHSAVVMRGGVGTVYAVVDGSKVKQISVTTGRQSDELIEITSPIDLHAQIVQTGGAFLFDGASVFVLDKKRSGK
ncbi:efflux RND transporter periplasmic adaptor subunit [Ensifer sp. YR511]|uniref:efflux RND transporter periplasmic adaptor subunit n=1 Tax=Ensifer sp. YR511 TaxID=1855294 RepID=UPI00088303C2|nr:efflux RND transporter periplasmic adaptor subunit [Ensifer sp. YR511]SDN36041.1 RND family efflux transporter, MFP subunit [Ensifer sp. YR511]